MCQNNKQQRGINLQQARVATTADESEETHEMMESVTTQGGGQAGQQSDRIRGAGGIILKKIPAR